MIGLNVTWNNKNLHLARSMQYQKTPSWPHQSVSNDKLAGAGQTHILLLVPAPDGKQQWESFLLHLTVYGEMIGRCHGIYCHHSLEKESTLQCQQPHILTTPSNPSTSPCPLLPVSLSGPWQTLWSGLLSAARVFVCSLSHLVAWHAAQCASSPSEHP